jgi:hypothetical protein
MKPILLLATITPQFPGVAAAQTAADVSLAEYLSLSAEQKAAINENNAAYTRTSLLKQDRLAQVEKEIRDETARSPLDPGALGIRYAGIEAACRYLGEEGCTVRDRNLALLTDVQKTRIKALEEALRLLPLAQESQGAGLVVYDRPLSLLLSVSGRPPRQPAAGGVYTRGLPGFFRSLIAC